jgi:hypothetical protein
VGVANDSHVADILTFVGLHKITPESFDSKAGRHRSALPKHFAYGSGLKRRPTPYYQNKLHPNGHSAARTRPKARVEDAQSWDGRAKPHVPCGTGRRTPKQSIVAHGEGWLNFRLTVTKLFHRCDTRGRAKVP